MKRIFLFLIVILAMSLSACASSNPQPAIDFVPPAPAITTTLQEQVAEMATPTQVPTVLVSATLAPTATAAVVAETVVAETVVAETVGAETATTPAAKMPPLKSGGWQRVGKGLPFSFELPNNWICPTVTGSGFWVPAGAPNVEGRPGLGVNEVEISGNVETALLPRNFAVESRTPLKANGVDYSLIKIQVYNGEGGTLNAYETFVIIRKDNIGKAYGLYITSGTAEGRAALHDILVHAMETLSYNE